MTPRAATLAAKDRIAFDLSWGVLSSDNGGRKYGVVNGRMILTKRYRLRKESAALAAMLMIPAHRRITSGPVVMHLCVHAPDNRRRDITNLLKLICDALTGAAYADDSQIAKLTIERGAVSKDNPRVEITVEAM